MQAALVGWFHPSHVSQPNKSPFVIRIHPVGFIPLGYLPSLVKLKATLGETQSHSSGGSTSRLLEFWESELLCTPYFLSYSETKAIHRKLLFFASKNISSLAHLAILSLSFLHNDWIFPFPFCKVTCLIKSTSGSKTEALCFTEDPIKPLLGTFCHKDNPK